MAQIPFYDDPEAESVLRMGPSGGALVLVSNTAHVSVRLENKFDDQTSVGKNFKRVKFVGIKPLEITVTFVVLPEDDRAFYNDVTPLFRQKGKNGNSPPNSIVNLQVNRLGVDVVSIVSAEIGPPDAKDGRAVTLNLKEWTPAPTKPKESKAAVDSRNPLNLGQNASKNNQ